MCARAQPLLSIQEKSKEGRFQKKREHSFHRERLADHATGKARKMGPVGAELEFHRNPRHYANNEIDAKNANPETGCLVIDFVVAAQPQSLQHDNQRRKPHGELGKQIMKSNSEGKVQAMNQQCAIHEEISLGNLKKNISKSASTCCDAGHTGGPSLARSLVTFEMFLAHLAALARIIVAAPLIFGLRNHCWNLHAASASVDGHEGQVGRTHVLA